MLTCSAFEFKTINLQHIFCNLIQAENHEKEAKVDHARTGIL